MVILDRNTTQGLNDQRHPLNACIRKCSEDGLLPSTGAVTIQACLVSLSRCTQRALMKRDQELQSYDPAVLLCRCFRPLVVGSR